MEHTIKRLKLTYGSAIVSENITDETKKALNKITELVFKDQRNKLYTSSVINSNHLK